jgi:hypothetical protein
MLRLWCTCHRAISSLGVGVCNRCNGAGLDTYIQKPDEVPNCPYSSPLLHVHCILSASGKDKHLAQLPQPRESTHSLTNCAVPIDGLAEMLHLYPLQMIYPQ